MKNLINDIRRNTPKSIQGYHYLKTYKIYIPFMRITIECLTRKISELNLFFESIMMLIENSIKDINEIAMILGVSYDVVKEAIIDMVDINYIYTSENVLGITPKGKKALKTRQRVDIQKTYLNDIMVDMITGTIYDADTIKVSKAQKRDVLLEGIVQLDDGFLDSHFSDINDIYQLQQKNNSVFGNTAITSELYKTDKISYSELHYVENIVYMYGSESSNEVIFVFNNDPNDHYKNEFYNQLKDNCRPCQEFFFENNRTLISNIQNKSISLDTELMKQTENVRKLLFTDNVPDETKIDAFTKRRYALNDNEYISYLYNPKSLRYSRIFISSDHLNVILSPAFCYQLNIIAKKIPVFIIYDKNEYNIEKSLKYLFSNPSENLHLIPEDNIEDNLICFDSKLVMYLHEKVVMAFEKLLLCMQPICDFDSNKASRIANSFIEKYNLEQYLSEKNNHIPVITKKRKKKKYYRNNFTSG